ncbi:MAG: hypothetical protein OHK0057_34810 [Thermoflexibacter sp.]
MAQGSGSAVQLDGTTGYLQSGEDANVLFSEDLRMEGWFKFDDVTKAVFLITIANDEAASGAPVFPNPATTPPFRTQKALWWSGSTGELNIPANHFVITIRDNSGLFNNAGGCGLVTENRGRFWDFYFPFTLQPNVWYHLSAIINDDATGDNLSTQMLVNGVALTSSDNVLRTTPSGSGGTCPNILSNVPITPSTLPTVDIAGRIIAGATYPVIATGDVETNIFIGMRPDELLSGNTLPDADFLFAGQIDHIRLSNSGRNETTVRTNMCNNSVTNLMTYTFDDAPDYDDTGTLPTQPPLRPIGGVTQVLSGAPIGNASSHVYGGTSLTLNYPPAGTSTFGVNVTAGTSNVLHIYRVDASPNNTTLPTEMGNFDTRYFGIFTGTDNITYDAVYTYTTNTAPNPPLSGSPIALAVARRLRNNARVADGDDRQFTFQAGTVNTMATTHTVTGLTTDLSAATPRNQQEFIYGAVSDPILANIETAAINYSEGAGDPSTNPTVNITNNITVNYPGTLTSATVQITGNYQDGQDILGFVNGTYGGVAFSGTFNAATGTMTITPDVAGTGTANATRDALRAVTYYNNSDNPNTSTRTVTFRVIDGAKQSNTQTRNINITAVNDAPTLSAQTCSGATFTENGAAVNILTAITVNDPDNTSLSTATIRITNVQASDVLSFTAIGGNPVTLASYNAGTGTLTLNVNGATHAQLAAALQAVQFSNSSQNPNTTPRIIRFTVRDAVLNSNDVDCTINVISVNDAPAINPATSSVTYNKLASAVTVASSATITDLDNTTLAGMTLNIGSYNAGEDIITFTCPAGVTCSAVGATMTFTDIASLASYQALIRSFTYRNSSATPTGTDRTFTFQVDDGEAANNLSNNAVFTVNINANFNIEPTIDAGCPTTLANFTEGDNTLAIFPNPVDINDIDNTNLSKAEFKITTGYRNGEDELLYDDDAIPLPGTLTATWNAATGTLTIAGVDLITEYEAILPRIKFKNESQNPTAGNRTITVQFFDNGFPDGTVANIKSTALCSFQIRVIPVNDPPVLDNIGVSPITYTENDPPLIITSTIEVTDVDNTNMTSATVSITGNYQNGQDVLEFANQLGITGTWNVTTGVLTLSGSSSKANYQTALRSVTYKNTSENPSDLVRTVSFRVNDGQSTDNLSNILTIDINVVPVNDPPVLANIESTPLTYTEGDLLKIITSNITIADVDDDNMESATIAITSGYQNGEDLLFFTNQLGITGSFNSTTGVLTLTGTSSKANYQTALRSVSYLNLSNDPNTTDRTITFSVNDGDLNSNFQSRTIKVISVNNAPIITYAPVDAQTYVENEAPKSIFPFPNNFAIIDLDNINLVRATIQITTNYFANQDVLGFTNQLGITGSWDAITGTLTLTGVSSVANYQTAIRSVTYVNTSENPSNLPRTLTIIANDGITNSVPTITQIINVIPVNDPPVVTNINRQIIINGSLQLFSNPFEEAYADIESDPLQRIIITSLPNNGKLKNNNVDVVLNQEISVADINLNYEPNLDYVGNDFFEWRASDRATGMSLSNIARVNIQVGLPSLYPPDKLKAQAGSRQVLLTWDPVVATGLNMQYEIYMLAPNQPWKLVGTTNEEKFLVTGLENATVYSFRVLAFDNLGRRSDFSITVSARPSIVLGTEDDLSALQINLFPNPNTGSFVVQFVEKTSKKANLSIINTIGQRVFEKEIKSSIGLYEEKIEVEVLSEGTYILQISTGTNTYQKRFVVQK